MRRKIFAKNALRIFKCLKKFVPADFSPTKRKWEGKTLAKQANSGKKSFLASLERHHPAKAQKNFLDFLDFGRRAKKISNFWPF